MKSKHLLAISLLGAASWLGAQNLDWYTYWGSDAAGSEITPRKIRVDRQGDIYAAATFGGTEVDIMGEKTASNSSVSNGDAVIVKLGADNQLIWKKTLAGSGTATVADMELDAEGNLFVAGDFSTLLQPDDSHSMPLDMPTGYEMEAAYVIRFSPEGEVLHMWQMPSEGIQVYDLALDAEGNVYVAGWFDSEMTFDGNPDNLQGSTSKTAQLYVAKYNASGELQSLVMDDQATYSNAFVDVDTDGSLFVAATFMGTTTLAGTTLTTPSTAGNMMLAKYDAEGNALGAKRIGGTWTDATPTSKPPNAPATTSASSPSTRRTATTAGGTPSGRAAPPPKAAAWPTTSTAPTRACGTWADGLPAATATARPSTSATPNRASA